MSGEPVRPRPRSVDGRFDPLPEWLGPGTLAVHADRRPERNAGAVVAPIYQTSTFHSPEENSEARGDGQVFLYTRYENPTHQAVQEVVRRLEGAQGARVFASGMGAIAATVLANVEAGDEVVALETLYGGTLDLLSELLPRFGVRVRWVSDGPAQEPESVLGPSTRLVLLESPTNPTLRVHDLARWARAADRVGALSVVDSTLATPVNQRPLALGADLVVHSATKYLGGHSDLVAGVVAGPHKLLERIDRTRWILGATLDPLAAFLLLRGLRTLSVRMARHNANGAAVSEALRSHPKVRSVHYPGSFSPAEASLASTQMQGRSGMVGLVLEGGRPAARRFLKALRLVHVAPSLGGVESLASIPSETSHVHLSEAELAARGIAPGFVRLSLGIEESDDLLKDLRDALDTL